MWPPARKPSNFKGSVRRLIGYLRAERLMAILIVVMGVVSVTLSVLGPKILGRATDIIFTGFINQSLPAGATKPEVVAGLRAQGDEGRPILSVR